MDDLEDGLCYRADALYHEFFEFSIQQIKADQWHWSCKFLGKQYACGDEPSEKRAIAMARAARHARWAIELDELPPRDMSGEQ
jgi:hypothetical protein